MIAAIQVVWPSMKQELLQQLRTLRNEIAHGQRPDAESLGKWAQDLGVSVSSADLQGFLAELLRGFNNAGEHFVPPVLLDVASCLLEGFSAGVACDPWAGFGVLAARVHEAAHASKTIACVRNPSNVALARVLAPQLDWQIGDPLALLAALSEPLDVVAAVLPFGVQADQAVELLDMSGEPVRCNGELGPIVLAAAAMRLSPEGIGLFVVSPSFFFGQRSILRNLPRLGLGVEAALALPAGSFAPFSSTSAYLIVVRKRASAQMFVAQLSQDIHTNRQIVANLREGKTDGVLELGRFVSPETFRGLESMRLAEQLRQAEHRFEGPAVQLGTLAQEIQLGRPSDEFQFSGAENALYIPLIGISDVVDSTEAMTLKRQNYAQVMVDATRCDARFVARFLNSELGRSIRGASQAGTTIPRLNTTGLKDLAVFVPNLRIQRKILEIEARLGAEQNTLLGLRSELESLRRDLWNSPVRLTDVDSRLRTFSGRFAAGAASHVAASREQWFETLPFPLASVLRAWQATPTHDYKVKYEYLLHFFEAVAQFLSVIYLSAYSSRPEFYADHRSKLVEAWKEQHMSLERPTFGTWKVVVEYFGKRTRELLSGDSDKRTLCAQLFADPTLVLPEMLSRKELASVLQAGNTMRNDWTGHGGVVSPDEAKLRNERLVSELHRLRQAMDDGWDQVRLIRALHCKPRRGQFETDVAVLLGSNSEFLKESWSMASWLDVERLHIASGDGRLALQLVPLMQVGRSPSSAKNACYFFNRVEKDGSLRFISHHFAEESELKEQSDDTSAAIRFLSEVGPGR